MAFGKLIDNRKQNKRNRLVSLFREHGGLSKAQARQLSGYSMDTLISLFKSLEQDGYISAADPLTEEKSKGRPAERYTLNTEKEIYWGTTFNQTGIWTTLLGFGGGELVTKYDELPDLADQTGFEEFVRKHVSTCFHDNEGRLGSLKRIGLALPGYVDRNSKMLVRYKQLPFLKDLDLIPLFNNCLPPISISVQHNITGIVTIFLKDRELVSKYRRIVFIYAETGSALALIQDGRLILDDGELGHLSISGSSRDCRCGRKGCLDTVFSAAEFHRLCPSSNWENLSNILAYESDVSKALWPIIEPPFRAFTEALLDVMAAYSPDLVVLSGEIFSILPKVEAWIMACINEIYQEDPPPWVPDSIIYRKTSAGSAAGGICRTMLEEDWAWEEEPASP